MNRPIYFNRQESTSNFYWYQSRYFIDFTKYDNFKYQKIIIDKNLIDKLKMCLVTFTTYSMVTSAGMQILGCLLSVGYNK